MKRKIIECCLVTSSRAEYGLLKPLIKKLLIDKGINLSLVATGTHLEKQFGLTFREIEKDGITINTKINIKMNDTSFKGVGNSFSQAISKFTTYFLSNRPSLLIVLGDRYEILAVSIAAYLLQIPIAHINGGEATSGTLDEGFRHSITKLASLHFTSTENYRQRVIQLGEHPNTVFNVGVLSVDNIKTYKRIAKKDLEKDIQFRFKYPSALITFHPTPMDKISSEEQLLNLLKALDNLPELSILFTKSNADQGGNKLNELITEFVKSRNNATLIDSLGMVRFLSAMTYIDIMIGNSSAGIVEMPYFRKPTINIGERQNGRLKAKSIIDVDCGRQSIVNAIKLSLSNSFQSKCQNMTSLFGDGNAATQIVSIIKKKTNEINLKKEFFDINFKHH
jgi:GDP/UDP-N,N'-diacetylbacillosamine 2-epimerase (hydrolysing)